MTVAERWADVSDRCQAARGERPAPEMPTLTQWALMYLISAVYWMLYHEFGPDACGEPGTEPRDTWDSGGTFGEGHRAMWGL